MSCNEFFSFYVRKVTKKYLHLHRDTLLNKLKNGGKWADEATKPHAIAEFVMSTLQLGRLIDIKLYNNKNYGKIYQ